MVKQSSETRHFVLGAAAARLYWEKLDKADLPKDPRTPEFANAVVSTFIECLDSRSAVDKKAIEGAARSAEQLNVSEFHGINEVIQNADDSGAKRVDVLLRTLSKRRYLDIVHNGNPIELPHVLPIVIPYLTTKDDDPFLKGKFGIGLKTCARFSDCMDVHCPPYHFRAAGHSLELIKPAARIPKIYETKGAQTLFRFRLRKEFSLDEFRAWLDEWDASSLLFLDSVTEFVVQLSPKREFEFRLDARSLFKPQTIKVRGQSRPMFGKLLKTRDGRQKWHRYSVKFKIPNDLKRRYKKTGIETAVSVGIPSHESRGRMFVGLPTEIRLPTPIQIDAQFDPDPSRERLINSRWNDWLLRRVGDVLVAAATDLFARGDPSAWNAVPISSEDAGNDDRLKTELSSIIQHAGKSVARTARIKIGRGSIGWNQIAYAEESIEPLLNAQDINELTDGFELLPNSRRDQYGRWRRVLDDYGVAHQIAVDEVLELFDDEKLGQRKPPSWFIEVAYHAIDQDIGDGLFDHPSVLLADRSQVTPQAKEEMTDILLVRETDLSFSEDHGVSYRVHAEYRKRNDKATTVRSYLEEHANLFGTVDAYNFLLAFANRGADTPVATGDKELAAIRDMFSQLDKAQAIELGPSLGNSICVDAFSWNGEKKERTKARISECYLPSSMEGGGLGWSVAAGETADIIWLDPRYKKALIAGGRISKRATSKRSNDRKLGAQAFFRALGAETAPRVEPDPDGWQRFRPYDGSVPESQRRYVLTFSSHPEALKGDSKSADLMRVVKDICRTKRKSDRKRRGIALFETLARNWPRLYVGATKVAAGYHYYSWKKLGPLPATWIAQLMDHDWLSNQQGNPKKPPELGLKNPFTLATYGNAPAFFAADIGSEGNRKKLADAIGMETEPTASRIVELLEEMKASDEAPDEDLLNFRYSALAHFCPKDAESVGSTTKVSDITVSRLRQRFGHKDDSKGLIYIGSTWMSPGAVYLGKPIFRDRRTFVPDGTEISRLWTTLGVSKPSISDCLDVLDEIAAQQPTDGDRPLLLETYRHIESDISNATKVEKSRLQRVPLWCGKEWHRKRPIYLVSDERLALQASEFARVWRPPGGTIDLQSFLGATGVIEIDATSFPIMGADDASAAEDLHLQHLFEASLRLLRDYLALNSDTAYRSLRIPWDRLLESRIRISPRLGIRFGLPGHKKRPLSINCYFDSNTDTFWIRDDTLIDQKADGCRIVSERFQSPKHKETIELAWHYCWHQAQHGNRSQDLELSLEEADVRDPLADIAQAAKRAGKKRSTYDRTSKLSDTSGHRRDTQHRQPLRHLKPLSALETSSVEIRNENDTSGGIKPKKARGLKEVPPSAPTVTGTTSSQAGGRATYNNNQLEDHALRCLHHVLTKADLGEFKDLRKFRNVGADSILNLKEFFEIKATAGELPSTKTLTRSEFKRAREEKENYFMAVVTGLEEGYDEVTVRIYNNPVETLDWSPSSDVVFSGFQEKRHLAVTIKPLRDK